MALTVQFSENNSAMSVAFDSVQTVTNIITAYEVAVANGYEGTVEEWLASLQGPPGPPGEPGVGEPGPPGKDGFSPMVEVQGITGGHRVMITDAQGKKTIDVMDGEDGITPVKGVDYLTEDEITKVAKEAAKLVSSGDVTVGVDFEVDETLTLENGVLSVNRAEEPEPDNTLPITSAAVYVTVGNINALLETI